jgi:hypothetical protein
MLVTLSCLFYTLFLFDTLGDAVGFQDALWVLIVVPLLPMCMHASYSVGTLCGKPRENKDEGADSPAVSVELSPMQSPHCSVSEDTTNAMFAAAL